MITKYRAYNKTHKKMYPVSAIVFKAEVVRYDLACPAVVEEDIDTVELWTSDGCFTKNIKEIELLHFIGITDKNKNELYTGDIVKYQGRNYEIYFDEKYGCYALKTNRYGKIEPLGHGGSSTKYSPYLWNWLSKKVEKVGNVFENEDLLK